MARDATVQHGSKRSIEDDVTHAGDIEDARVECYFLLGELDRRLTQCVTDRAVRIVVARDAI